MCANKNHLSTRSIRGMYFFFIHIYININIYLFIRSWLSKRKSLAFFFFVFCFCNTFIGEKKFSLSVFLSYKIPLQLLTSAGSRIHERRPARTTRMEMRSPRPRYNIFRFFFSFYLPLVSLWKISLFRTFSPRFSAHITRAVLFYSFRLHK